jgi:hypothetical protein
LPLGLKVARQRALSEAPELNVTVPPPFHEPARSAAAAGVEIVAAASINAPSVEERNKVFAAFCIRLPIF